MIRSFNYTGRKKIKRERIEITLLNDKNGRYFKARVNLDGLGFAPDAKIIIEPHYKGVQQRFHFGTVADFREPADTRLSELPDTELVFFDVSVVDDSQEVGLILGKASAVPAGIQDSPGSRIPLLYVNSVDLKDQIWKVSFEGADGRPILEINNRIPELKDLLRHNKTFISLVYPIAFRIILRQIAEEDHYDDIETWQGQWFRFLETALGITTFPEKDLDNESQDIDSWIDDCVNAFCRKTNMIEKLTEK